jgi:peptidoglycan/xylan/chitin deacetylase (PgdA/CDA1 family)
VSRALAVARVRPRDGVLYSVVHHRVLDPHAERAVIRRNGTQVSLSTTLHRGDRVSVLDGIDFPEPLMRTEQPVPGGGLPAVENVLWDPPRDGMADLRAGARSGEVESRAVMVAPMPARPRPGNVVALTFDDGPDPRYTPILLQMLHDEGVKATFCIVAHVARRHPEIVKAIADGGHRLCDHTEHHVEHLERRSPAEIEGEITSCADFIRQVTGRPPALYRAPGGTLSPLVVDIAHRHGMRVLGWSADPHDYVPQAPPALLLRTFNSIHPGSVVLLHDGGGDGLYTVSMVQELIRMLRFVGFTVTTP